MNKKLIRLTESELHRIIEESATNILTENEMEEGWLGDKWNQTKSAVGTAFNPNRSLEKQICICLIYKYLLTLPRKKQERIGILKVI